MLTDYTLQIALGQSSSYVLAAYALQLYLVRSVIIDMLASFGSFIIVDLQSLRRFNACMCLLLPKHRLFV